MELIPAQLAHNPAAAGLILLYAIINILAWGKNGIFIQELAALKDTRNERTFSLGEAHFNKIRPMLIIQYYIFFGLSLYTVVVPHPAETLKSIMGIPLEVYYTLAICVAIPIAWYFLQYFFFHWICFIFGGDSRIVILERIYKAIHILAGPVAMVLFSVITIADISVLWTSILLTGIFIITQIVFIYSGFKIFFSSFGSLCLFFVYLCALEIAPLAVIYIKLG